MLLMGLLPPALEMGGREVIEAAAGTIGGERWPDGGDDTDELSGLRESGEKHFSHVNESFSTAILQHMGVPKETIQV